MRNGQTPEPQKVTKSHPRGQGGFRCHGQRFEMLESRVLLAAVAANVFDVGNIPVNTPTTTNLSDTKHGPMANTGAGLIDLYQDYRRYRNAGGTDANWTPTSVEKSLFVFKGSMVGVTVRGRINSAALTTVLRKYNAQIVYRNGKYQAIDALVPINQLHALAVDKQVAAVNPLAPYYLATTGTSGNQADVAQKTDQVRSVFGLDGTGVKVGVLSDSVNAVGNGVSASVATGDLPGDGVQVISDRPPILAPTDEGRAMLEEIHDLAPGAELAFADAGLSQQVFADHVRALRAAGSDVIVDDIGFLTEPMFQPGVIDQAIRDVTGDGAIYVSSASNNNDAAYEASTNFTKIGRQTFVDFDPGPGVATRMRISFPDSLGITQFVPMIFQWDNPYNGIVGGATTDLDITFYDPNHPNRVLATGNTNNIQSGLPLEMFNIPTRTMDVEIRVVDSVQGKPLPTTFKFVTYTNQGFSLQTEHPENQRFIYGHNGGPWTISTGAVAFFNAPPVAPVSAGIINEDFSSVGPVTQIFDAAGNRLHTPLELQKPDISGIENVNTSFFGTDVPQDDDVLPNFSGTSAAAPNIAAVAALAKQISPDISSTEFSSAIKATAQQINGTPVGEFDPKGGFGLIDARAAIEQFVTNPTVAIQKVAVNPTDSPISTITIKFSQQVTGFDLADLRLSVDGGPNLLTGGNPLTTTDGGRTYQLTNLASVTATPGTYTLDLIDSGPTIQNTVGLPLEDSATQSWTNVGPQARPAKPSNLRVKALNDTSVRLDWTDNSNNENGFQIQRAEDDAFTKNVKSFRVGANVTTFLDGSAPVGRGLFYRVRAINSFSGFSSYSNIAGTTTLSPGEIILDNESTSRVTITGPWSVSSSGSGFFGSSFLTDDNTDKGTKSVRYNPNFEFSGDYFVYARWTKAADRATNVPIDIVSGNNSTTVRVDQRNTGGSGWVLLGKFHFNQGTAGSVTIRTTGTNGVVIADAIRFLSTEGGNPNPPTS